MRASPLLLATLVAGGCAASEGDYEAPPPPSVLDHIYEQTIRPGDVIVMIPGTGAVDYLATPIDAMPGDHPEVDVLANEDVKSDAVVLEQAIAMVHRSGISDEDLQNGAVTFLLWGAGMQRVTSFDYVSYERLHVNIDVLGGQNSCAVGTITDNYLNYSKTNASIDAHDVYSRLQTWLSAHPSTTARNVVVASHSWGGAVGEFLTLEHDAIVAELGPLPTGASMPFTVAAGVPEFIIGYSFIGPKVLDYQRPDGLRTLYEIDRPDDPVHVLSFNGDFGGHHYNIVWDGEFRGAYGVTTEDLSCHEMPGPCAMPTPDSGSGT